MAEDENLKEHRVMEEYIMNGTAGSLWLPMTKRVYNQLVAVGKSKESMIKVNFLINNDRSIWGHKCSKTKIIMEVAKTITGTIENFHDHYYK